MMFDLLVMGLLGEVLARIYYECQDKKPYAVRRAWNFESDECHGTDWKRAA